MTTTRSLTVRFLLLGAVVVFGFLCTGAFAQLPEAPMATGPTPEEPQITIPLIWWVAPIGAILALLFAHLFYKQVMECDEGDPEMIEIAAHVRDGALAYLKRQYRVVAIVFLVVSALLAVMAFVFHAQHGIVFIAFLTGGFFSGLCGWLGMKTATNAAHRTAAGARASLNRGLVVAFRAGAVMGLVVVGFGLIDIAGWFLLLAKVIPWFAEQLDFAFHMDLTEITVVMLTFGMGASTQALFARVGGGIYTKAADVGADLVGKVEAGIPEDDPRNPATIADNVGDNVGDVAGMGADLYESYCGSILATAALGVAAAAALAEGSLEAAYANGVRFLAAPMILAGIGIVLSVIGIYMVRTREGASMAQLMGALGRGVNGSSVMIALAALWVCYALFSNILPGDVAVGARPMPDEFPTVEVGTEFAVGEAYSGTFDEGRDDTLVALAATDGQEISVRWRDDDQRKSLVTSMRVIDNNLFEPDQQLKVTIGGTPVGTLMVDANGAGTLAFDTNAHSVVRWWGIWLAIIAGLFAGVIIGKATEYYTSYDYAPTKLISGQAVTGPATVIISGVAAGMKSTWASLLTIVVAILVAFYAAGGNTEFMLGLYGVGIAAVGMLATLGITLATDAYGPIADNAGGNAEMTNQKPEVRKRTDALDSLGNTTAATGKGFAIGSAALTALALLAAYVEEVRVGQIRQAQATVADVLDTPDDETAIYIGHGKFAMYPPSPTGRARYDCLMLIGTAPEDLRPGDQITDLGQLTEHGTRAATVAGQEFNLVSARRASMAQFMEFYDVTLMNPRVLCGAFCGVMLAFVFCAMTMQAVGRAANRMMLECRRQFGKMRAYLKSQGHDDAFAANPNNWPRSQVEFEGVKYPQYAECVAIATAGAQKEMIVPSLMAISAPVVVGLILGVGGVMGLLVGGLTCGFALAIFMANAGGAWDNAKKLIETFGTVTAKQFREDAAIREKVPAATREALIARAESADDDDIIYGKGSEEHKAGVVGDTVGDPFKDTSGPSLNILIKLMSMVSVVAAGVIVKFAPQIGALLGFN